MTTTEKVFRRHLETVTTDRATWLTLFQADAVVEFPFAKAIGFPDRIVGIDAIKRYSEALPSGFEDFRFSDLKVYLHENSESLTAEFRGYIPSRGDRPEYKQTYICLCEVKNGKISHYKEFWEPIEVTKFFGGAK